MRTVVDLPQEELEAIKALAQREGISQAEAIRRSVRAYLSTQPLPGVASPAFGIWAQGKEGVAYQRDLREEWAE
jgi:hypothetical protein